MNYRMKDGTVCSSLVLLINVFNDIPECYVCPNCMRTYGTKNAAIEPKRGVTTSRSQGLNYPFSPRVNAPDNAIPSPTEESLPPL